MLMGLMVAMAFLFAVFIFPYIVARSTQETIDDA